MKASKKRSRVTRKRWRRTAKVAPALKLEMALKSHISDLRVLIDEGLAREKQLASLVQLTVEHHYFRPARTGKPAENVATPALPPDQMQDVAVFDEKADAEQVSLHDERTAQLESELAALVGEQNEQGIHKVSE